jgi:hypothetical protein
MSGLRQQEVCRFSGVHKSFVSGFAAQKNLSERIGNSTEGMPRDADFVIEEWTPVDSRWDGVIAIALEAWVLTYLHAQHTPVPQVICTDTSLQ